MRQEVALSARQTAAAAAPVDQIVVVARMAVAVAWAVQRAAVVVVVARTAVEAVLVAQTVVAVLVVVGAVARSHS